MKAMVIVAHGSRRMASNEEVRQLALSVSTHTHRYDKVSAAFLELAEPSIPDGIRQAIGQGASEVVVMPFFLSAGRHVTEDIPNEVAIVKKEYPHLSIRIAPYVGSALAMASLVIDQGNKLK